MYIKRCWKYLFYIIAAIIVIILFLKLSTPATLNNETLYVPYISIKIYDLGSLVALIVGLLAFIGTIYSTDKNYRASKLTSLPDNSANLLIDLEFIFSKDDDEVFLLTEILKYWKDHQKAFRLLTPHFYKEFLKIVTEKSSEELNTSQYIMKALIAQITNVAFDSDEPNFTFIKPELIKENINIEELGNDLKNYTTVRMTKNDLNAYIESIDDDNTKKLTKNEFEKLTNDIENILKDLKREIDEYD